MIHNHVSINQIFANECKACEDKYFCQSIRFLHCFALLLEMGSEGVGGCLVAAVHLNLPDRVIDKILNLAAG